ncbi:MAG: O-antigen ligase family protein [Steroidobacteraceae bacterium]
MSALILMLVFCNIFSLELSLAPGLSAKNAVLYIAASFIAFRLVVSRNFHLEMGQFVAVFISLVAYAVATWLVAGLFIEYKGYSLLNSGILLKSDLVDPLIFFLTFLYGARSSQDAIMILKVILIGGVLMHLATLGDAFNIYSVGDFMGEGGRMAGPIGEPNGYGDFIAMFLPPLCAAIATSRGLARLWWVVATALSVAALLTTASRAAFIAVLLSSALGAYLLRRYLPAEKILPWLAKAAFVGFIVVFAVSVEFGELLYSRIVGQSQTISAATLSSGRTEFWSDLINLMMAHPLTLLTGFGWDSYSTMGFYFAAHNYYLALWFNLGLPGLILGITPFFIVIRTAWRAIDQANSAYQPYLIAFIFTVLATLIAVFFGEIFGPWQYFWSYAGLAMRLAIDATRKPAPISSSNPGAKALTA